MLGREVQREARALTRLMATYGVDLVYGGGSVGVMGTVARGVDRAGGKVYGVIPKVGASMNCVHNVPV